MYAVCGGLRVVVFATFSSFWLLEVSGFWGEGGVAVFVDISPFSSRNYRGHRISPLPPP